MHIDIKNLRDVEAEKEISFDELVDIVEDAVNRAYVKHITPVPAELGDRPAPVKMEDEHGNPRARSVLDRKTGDISIFTPTYNEDGELTGEELVEDTDFGYIAASEAKRVLVQRIRAIDDEKILGEFSHKKGDLISGVIQQSSNSKMVQVLIAKNLEAVMPSAEQVAGEEYIHGKRIRVVITDVKKGLKGPSITVSRHHPDLVKRLFELEVPEIGQGLVKIAAISRHQGHRTKIAVFSTEPGFNAKGAFIGELGARVRNVSKELGDEKIDIVDYSPNIAEFVAHALSPAKVTKAVLVDEATNAVRAFVPEYQLSLAIGKDGQNARLAAMLTRAKIDVKSDTLLERLARKLNPTNPSKGNTMKKFFTVATALALATVGFAAAPASATTPAASYDFDMDGAFADSIGSATIAGATTCSSPGVSDLCNTSANFGTDSIGDFWHWVTTQDNGGGAVLTTSAQLGNTYSLYFKFAMEEASRDTSASNCAAPDENYSKLLDFMDKTIDTGLYTQGCDPFLISTGFETGTASIPLGDVVEIVVSRNDTSSEVTVFINYGNGYEESFVTDDSADEFIPADSGSGSIIRMFQDDGTDGTAEGVKEGRLYGVKAWAGTALTIDQLDGLVTVTPDTNNEDELPNTGIDGAQSSTLLGFGIAALVAGAAVVVRRRRA